MLFRSACTRARPDQPRPRDRGEKKTMRDVLGWSDGAIKWDADHDDEYHDIDPALPHRRMNSSSLFEGMTRRKDGFRKGHSQ